MKHKLGLGLKLYSDMFQFLPKWLQPKTANILTSRAFQQMIHEKKNCLTFRNVWFLRISGFISVLSLWIVPNFLINCLWNEMLSHSTFFFFVYKHTQNMIKCAILNITCDINTKHEPFEMYACHIEACWCWKEGDMLEEINRRRVFHLLWNMSYE